ncbi:MAG TPA: sensor histidine kinase [Ancylobacter sp.]
MYVQPQPGEAKDHFLAKILVIIDKINERSDRVTALFRHFIAHQRHPPVQRLQGIGLHLIIALCILFGCLAAQTSWALPLDPADGVNAPVSLSGHLAVLHDPSGALTLDDILSGHSNIPFEPIPSMLTEGYRKGAIWVRFKLSAPETSNRWLLQVERPLIEQVTLYVPDGTGRYTTSAPGSVLPGDGDGADAYPTIFPIFVPSNSVKYYIRLQSSTSITTSLNVWQIQGYAEHRRLDDWIMAIVVGSIFVMIFTNLLYAAWLKDSLYIVYTALLFISSLISLFHMGYASEILQFLEPKTVHYSWGIIVCLYSIIMMLFLDRLFEFRRNWIWATRLSQLVIFLNVVALGFAILGRYGDVGFYVSRLQQLSLIFVAVFALYLLIVRRQYQYVLSAIAFLGVISVLLVMQMMYTGANPFLLDGSLSRLLAGGTVIHLILLSAAIAKRTQLAERSLSEEKDRVIAMSRSVERELATKVRERTAELADRNASLKAEVDRRHLLELKLRQSLDAVNDALAQQRDFVALVSHEFRGPLAVIAAAADNLSSEEGAGNTKLRATRIRQTVKRMSLLIENVLAGDRLNSGKKAFPTIGMVHLNEILRTAKAALDDDAARRVSFIHGDEVTVKGDRNLLEVAVQNLIQNALKYSAAPSSVTARLSTSRGMAFVHVMDQGTGVAPDDRELIFTKYYRAAGQSANGSGLGLYISREIAQQHGGDLTLVASGGNGSTFCLSLPIKGAEPLTA